MEEGTNTVLVWGDWTTGRPWKNLVARTQVPASSLPLLVGFCPIDERSEGVWEGDGNWRTVPESDPRLVGSSDLPLDPRRLSPRVPRLLYPLPVVGGRSECSKGVAVGKRPL